MKFSEALVECIENGKKITRKDWNGKDMYVYYTCGRKIPATSWDDRGNIKLTDHERMVGYVEVLGHLDMYNAQGNAYNGTNKFQTLYDFYKNATGDDTLASKWVNNLYGTSFNASSNK